MYKTTPLKAWFIYAFGGLMLVAKTADLAADISALAAETDCLFYDLHGFTTPKIAIIECNQSNGDVS